tara:strand:+ start:45640 stop:46842 length:1203 start_codon:yes stop_codon:yes gene_type:complete
MKQIKISLKIVILFVFSFGIFSCTDRDEYLKYTEGGEILYTGKIDSLVILPGKNRVKIEGLIIADPKVSQLRVYWLNRSDSVVIPINRTSGIDTISAIIDGLEENIYNFEVRTFDSKGNGSIAEFSSAEVFGERYQSSLFNRPIVSNVLIENDLTINYAGMDLSSGVIGTEIEYTNTLAELIDVFVSIDSTKLAIADFENGSTFRYRTAFIPIEGAIDTFHTEYVNIRPIPTPVLKNAEIPFVAAETDGGRWGTLSNWNTNDAAKNHGGFGGWDEWNGNIFNLESGWGAPGITNGKIYQTVIAEPGSYSLKVKLMNTNHQVADVGGAYFVIAKGDGLPNVEEVTSSTDVLGYKRILETSSVDYVVDFVIEETTEISVGELTTQSDAGRFANILSFEIVVK